jgi:hypothetical protein
VQFETWLREGVIDLAIVPLEAGSQGRQSQLRLARVPLVLLVPKKSRWKNTADLWKQKKIDEPSSACRPPRASREVSSRTCGAAGSNGASRSKPPRWRWSPGMSPPAPVSA